MLDVVVGIARTSRPRALLLGCLVLAGGTLPVAVTLATGAVVGRVPAAARDGLGSPSGEQVMGALAVFATVYVASIVAGALQQPLAVAVGLRFALYVREQVVTATTTPVGTAHLEDPAVADGELAEVVRAPHRRGRQLVG